MPLLLGAHDERLLLLVLGCEVSFQAVLPHHSLAPSWALHEVVIAACPVLLTWLAGELDIGSAAQRPLTAS